MKKILVFMLLLTLASGAFAQTGGLRINNNTPCGVWVKMFAQDATLPPAIGGLCNIESNTFYLPPGVYTWCSVWAFQTGTACGGPPPPTFWVAGPSGVVPSIPLTSTGFQWTDATYQFECPIGTFCDAGGNLTNSAPCLVPASPFTCLTPYPSPCLPALWIPACLPPMGNLTIIY